MRIPLKSIPPSPAYLVFHDAFDGGAMEVFLKPSYADAQKIANERNAANEACGEDEAGIWKAYEKLPRVRVWRVHL